MAFLLRRLPSALSATRSTASFGRATISQQRLSGRRSFSQTFRRFGGDHGHHEAPHETAWSFITPIATGTASAFLLLAGGYFLLGDIDYPPSSKTFKQDEHSAPSVPSTPRSEAKPTVVFVLGGPGAGKGTQCENLVRDFGFVHLSAGDLLRAERNRPDSEYGALIDNYIKEGLIVPMEITISLLERAMKQSPSNRFLIDGFPRKMDQAERFEETVVPSKMVLYFECPEEVMLERLMQRGKTSGRTDDNLESIRKRFVTFHETSFPVIEFYAKQNRVKTISCQGTPEQVYAQVRATFDDLFQGEEKKAHATH